MHVLVLCAEYRNSSSLPTVGYGYLSVEDQAPKNKALRLNKGRTMCKLLFLHIIIPHE